MRVSDELLDRLGDLYQKYAFTMTFGQFLEMVIGRLEERYGPSRLRTRVGCPQRPEASVGHHGHPEHERCNCLTREAVHQREAMPLGEPDLNRQETNDW